MSESMKNTRTFKIKALMTFMKIIRIIIVIQKLQLFLRIECYLFTEQYAGSTKTTFQSKANNHKSTHRNFMSKKETPRQALKQKLS